MNINNLVLIKDHDVLEGIVGGFTLAILTYILAKKFRLNTFNVVMISFMLTYIVRKAAVNFFLYIKKELMSFNSIINNRFFHK